MDDQDSMLLICGLCIWDSDDKESRYICKLSPGSIWPVCHGITIVKEEGLIICASYGLYIWLLVTNSRSICP